MEQYKTEGSYRMKKIKIVFFIVLIIALLWGCSGKNTNELVVYTTVDQIFSEPLLKDFEKQTGIKVKSLFDTEGKLAVSCAQMPLHKGVKTPENIPSLDNINTMKINYDITARKLEEIQEDLKLWVDNM